MPSDPNIELYGARLWTGDDNWDTAYRLTPRDFVPGSSFPDAGPPGGMATESFRVPSIFVNYKVGLRAQDEEALEGSDLPKPFATGGTFDPLAIALSPVVGGQPGDTVKVAVMLVNAGNALDAILADAFDRRSWALCPHRWADVLDPGGVSVESLEVAIPMSATPADTDTVFIATTSLSDKTKTGGAFALVIVGSGGPLPSPPDTVATPVPCANMYVTNGIVYDTVRKGSRIYVGGFFDYVGPPTGNAAALDATTADLLFPSMISGQVYAVEPDGVGGWYIGGIFQHVAGLPRENLVHILANSTIDDWNPGTNGVVNALKVSGDRLYVGGNFSQVGGQNHAGLAAIELATGQVAAWGPTTLTGGGIKAILVLGSRVYVGGSFTSIGGWPSRNLAWVDATSGAVNPWMPNPNAEVNHLAFGTSGGPTIYVSGAFTMIDGQPRNYLAAFNFSSQNLTTWNPNPNAIVATVLVSGSTVYVGGNFGNIGGQPRAGIAALDAGTGAATSWNPGTDGTVFALALNGATIFAGGLFTTAGGQPRRGLAALDATTGNAEAWVAHASDEVGCLATAGNSVYVGGHFSSIGGENRKSLVSLDANTGRVTSWNPDVSGQVAAIVVSDNTVYIGGLFGFVGSQPRNRIASIDATTGAVNPWNPSANGGVNTLALGGTTLYAGGLFTSIGGQARNRLAALNIGSGLATPWNPNANASVNKIQLEGEKLYVCGSFTTIGGQSRNRIAALITSSGNPTAWNPNANGTISTLSTLDGRVYAGGSFTTIGGAARRYLAALDSASGNAHVWNPNPDGSVRSLAMRPGFVDVGGNFTQIAGQARFYFAELTASSGLPTERNPILDGPVYALAADPYNILIGGDFYTVSVFSRRCYACLNLFPPPVGVPRQTSKFVQALFSRVSPNPSTRGTRIEYALPLAADVRIWIFDIQGRTVARLVDERKQAGSHSLTWDDPRCGPGVYLVHLEAAGMKSTQRLVKIR